MGPGLGVLLLASVTIGSIYWTSHIVKRTDTYFYTFSEAMDSAIEKAYGRAWKTESMSAEGRR